MRADGVVDVPSPYSVEDIVRRFEALVAAKGLKLFAKIDHSGEAEKIGLKMFPAKLLIFGSPAAGTPVMVAAPTSALDLPLKVLIWQQENGKVYISYNSAEYLAKRHAIPGELLKNIAGISALVEKALQ